MGGVDLTMLVRRIADLSARLDTMPALRWGTVQSANPLMVLLDGDTEAVAGLGALTSPAVGARVLVARWNRRGVILGSSQGRGQQSVQAGTITLPATSTTAKVTGNDAIRFPQAFAEPPLVFLSPDVDPSGRITVAMSVAEVTTTGANVRYVSTAAGAGDRQIKWLAVGTLA